MIRFSPPKKFSEAMLTAIMRGRLWAKGVEVYLEYPHEHCRFDLVVIKHGFITHIVEVKSRHTPRDISWHKQIKRYKCFGIPVLWVTHYSQIDPTVSAIVADLTKVGGTIGGAGSGGICQ